MNATRDLLQQLEAKRKTKILSLIYGNSTFINDDDDIEVVREVLDDICEGKRVDTMEIILSSLGGEANAHST